MTTVAGLGVVARAVAYVPATCGELVQGVDDDWGPLLVSLPLALAGSVSVTLVREPVWEVTPELPRARVALHLACERAGWRGGALVRLGGEVPRARGMGSSTVDVAGVLGAVLAARGVALSPGELVRLMTQVEPSDSSPLPGLWMIDHVKGRRAVRLGELPPEWRLVGVDSGATVDTAAAHRLWGPGPGLPGGTAAVLLHTQPEALARLATESAWRSQERLPHPAFAVLRRVAAATGAAGLCAAHSGSLCAVICTSDAQAARVAAAVRCEGLEPVVHAAAARGMRVDAAPKEGAWSVASVAVTARPGRASGRGQTPPSGLSASA